MKRNPLSLLNVPADSLVQDADLQSLVDRATPREVDALVHALRAAYVAGQDDSDARTGKLMARIFGGFVGVTPGIDVERDSDATTPRERLRNAVSLLAGVARRSR